MIELEPVIFIPLEVGGISLSGAKPSLYGSDAVFFLDFKSRMLRYRGFWRAAGISSITSVDEKIVVGTKNGVIIFDEQARAHWTGSKTAVFSGNFSNDTHVIAFSFYKEKRRRYLKLYPIRDADFLSESRRLQSRVIIPFFTPFGGPLDWDIIRYLKGLINVFDIDKNGYDELLLINPGVDSAYLVIVSINEGESGAEIRVDQEKLPSYTFRPIASFTGDLDQDGQLEIALLSNPSYNYFNVSMIDLTESEINVQSIMNIDISKKFSEASQDGEAWIGVGDVNGDGFVEINFIWEEKPYWGKVRSKLHILTKTFFGEELKVGEGKLEVFPPIEINMFDINGDGVDELVSLSPLGLEVVDSKSLEVVDFLPIMGSVNGILHLGKDSFFVVGELLKQRPDMCSYYYVEGSNIFLGGPIYKLKKIRVCGGNVFLLDDIGRLWSLKKKGLELLMESVTDLECFGGGLFTLNKSGFINKVESQGKPNEIGKVSSAISFVKGRKEIFVLTRGDGKYEMISLDGKNKSIIFSTEREVLNPIFLFEDGGEKYLIANMEDGLVIIDEKGSILTHLSDVKVQLDNYVIMEMEGREILSFLSNQTLYAFDPSNKIVTNLGYRGWSSITRSMDSKSEVFVVFENGIYKANVNEVVSVEPKEAQ